MSRNNAGQGHATKQLEAMYQFAVIAARLSSRLGYVLSGMTSTYMEKHRTWQQVLPLHLRGF